MATRARLKVACPQGYGLFGLDSRGLAPFRPAAQRTDPPAEAGGRRAEWWRGFL